MIRRLAGALAALLLLTAALPAAAQTSNMNVGGLSANVDGTLTKSTKTTAYTSGMLICQSSTAASCSAVAIDVARNADFTGMVRRIRLKVNDAGWLNATVAVHLFRDNPAFTNGDAGNFAGGLSESNYMGAADVLLDQSFSDPYVKGIGVPRVGSEINFNPASGTRTVYAVLEARSTTGTVGASKVFTVTLEALRN